MTAFLGFDPGGRFTGVVLRRRDDLLGWDVVIRRDDLTMPDGDYTSAVARAALAVLDRAGLEPRSPDLVVVSEGVRFWPQQPRKTGHRCNVCKQPHDPSQPRNLTGLLGAAIVHGAVLARWSDTVVVKPGSGHGSLHELAYPEPIRPPGKGKDNAQHARSAWDATHHGETLWRQQQRGVEA